MHSTVVLLPAAAGSPVGITLEKTVIHPVGHKHGPTV